MQELIGMRKILLSVVALTVTLFAVAVLASPASADGGGGCNVRDPSCTVVTGGGGGSGSGGDTGAGAGGSAADPCANYPTAAYGDRPPKVSQACAVELQSNFCSADVADAAGGLEKPPARWTAAETASVNSGLAAMGCPPVVTPAGLAQKAYKTIVFPHPSGSRSPSQTLLYKGFSFTYVNLWTYYWTAPGTWKTLIATASAAGFTATVTATPTQLILDPGDGSAAQSCSGPGRPWTDADGNSAPSAGACGYQYRQVTGSPIASTQLIVWKITWTGTGGSAGEIPQLVTSTTGQLNVMQIQTVVTR